MKINPGDGSGVFDEIDDICGSNIVSFPATAKLRRINFAIDQFYILALNYDKHWTFDDLNEFDSDGEDRQLPIASADLRAFEQDYPFALEFLTVKGVFAKDKQGIFHELEEEETPQNSFLLPTGNGVPTKYKIIGNSILLDPIPDYASALGLKIPFGRTGVKFTTSDYNKELGVPILFQEWICQVASLPYLIKNRLPNKNDIAALIAAKKNPENIDSIPYFMANRNQSKKPNMQVAYESNK